MWQITYASKVIKMVAKLPKDIQEIVCLLVRELEGPYRKNWKNYGKLKGDKNKYHCHLFKGKTTYVSCWEVIDKKIKLLEVYYVGSHEKAPY